MTTTPVQPAQFDLDTLCAQLTEAQQQFQAWETRKKALLDQLSAAHRDGIVPSKFERSGFTFNLQSGRKTIKLPPVLEAEIDLLKAKAIEDGTATVTWGSSFWRLTPKKD